MFLRIPGYVWALQIGYVVVALGLYTFLLFSMHMDTASSTKRSIFSIIYFTIIITLNVIWRDAIK